MAARRQAVGADAAELGGGVDRLAVGRLELGVTDAAQEDLLRALLEVDQGAGDRRLGVAALVALDRVVEESLEGRLHLGDQLGDSEVPHQPRRPRRLERVAAEGAAELPADELGVGLVAEIGDPVEALLEGRPIPLLRHRQEAYQPRGKTSIMLR